MQMPLQPVPPEFEQALRDLRLVADGTAGIRGRPLTGGVSSDIWCIELPEGPVCAKRALSRLRVAAEWHAPIERNRYEARWMQVADAAVPGSTPRLLGQHPALGVLVMSYLEPDSHPLWKQQLRDGQADEATARAVGDTLGRIHAHAAARPMLASQFDTDAIFFDIRLEPYLLAAAERHADLADVLKGLVVQTQSHPRSLVHGDVSPKNVLIGRWPDGATQPVLLDAECAWWGDPAFDLAFCLNHLLLKGLWTPTARDGFLRCYDALARAYLHRVDWEPATELEARAAALLPGLLLARVDGKSPVEYLTTEAQRESVRRCARALLAEQRGRRPDAASSATLAHVREAWQRETPP